MKNLESNFKEIYFKHHPLAFRVAYYITKESSTAEDIVQEVFLKLWKKRDRLGEISSLEGYLVQMVKNEAISFLEGNRKESQLHIQLSASEVQLHEEKEFDSEEFRLKLEKAVSRLSPKCRLIFSLSRFEGLTNEEIAQYLDISKRTVESQISLAFKRFRSDLKSLLISCFWLLLVFFAGL